MKNRIRVLNASAAIAFAVMTCAGASHASVVMDQIGPVFGGQDGQTANSCQDFEAVNNAFDVAVIDDFVLPVAFQLTQIEACFNGFGGFTSYGNVQSWRVEIYSSPASALTSLTGNVASVLVPLTNVTDLTQPWAAGAALSAKVTLDVSSFPALNLAAGTYWIAVIPVLNFGGGGGQIGLLQSGFAGNPGNINSRQVNPLGGFGFPGNQIALNVNMAIRITGTSALSIPPWTSGVAVPLNVASGEPVTLTATVTSGENPDSTTLSASVDLTFLGGAANTPMNDIGGNVFSLDLVVGSNLPCGNIILPVTVTDDLLRTGNGNIFVQPVSPLTPTPGATPDNEPDCGLPTDTVNAGCNVTPNNFGALTCGQTVQGTVRANNAARDTDWYSFTLTESTTVSWTVVGQADMIFGFIRNSTNLATPPVCGATLAINPVGTSIPCQCGTVSVTLGAGTWFTFVSTPFAAIPCGRTYEATLRCGAACPGDVNGDGNRDGRDVQAFVNSYPACFAGGVQNCTACRAVDVNGDNAFTTADVTELANLLLAGDACP